MSRKPKLEIQGDKALIRKLRKLGDRRQLKKILRRATNAAAQVVVKAVRAEWPTDSGLSKRSVVKKIVSTKAGYSAVIGIDKEAAEPRRGGSDEFHIPSNIDHLIEFGWQTPDGKTIPAVAPLRRGYDAAKDEAEKRFAEKVKQELEKEATKR
jgi:hypothetical protein